MEEQTDTSAPLPPPVGTRLFQINEDDLAELERVIPEWVFANMDRFDNNKERARFRRVQQILVNVRWHYGPFSNVERIPAD